MTNLKSAISVCRNCQHYSAEGRRGGQCQQLGVPVSGSWKVCSLAIPPFTPAWKIPNDISIWTAQHSSQSLGITPHSVRETLEVCIQSQLTEESSQRVKELESSICAGSSIEYSIE